uniref:AlNc14C167G7909 protein n=1 Tax=Albugo laibachii Nc14 TaxID=890382 RepID=F0WN77_9STRA|nr:AlNc14C167G7909 [Albugo laibachii Nc14]|eukprot:CCA22766.1 AlNc14C167G7909 [Albugo laibachii Nc14]
MLREGMASHASFLPLKFRVVLGTAAILKSHVEQSNRKQELLMVAIQQSSQSFIQRLIQDAGIKRCSIPLALALSLAGIGLEYQHVERLSALRKIKRTRFMFAKLFCSTIRVLLKLIFTRHRCIPSKMTQNQLVQVSTLRLHRTHQPIACSSHIELTPSAQIVKQDTSSISWSLCRAICAFRGSSFCSFGSKMVKTKVRSIFTEKEANALIRAFKISSVPGPGGTILFSSQFSYCCDPTSHHFVNIGTGSIPTSTQSDLTDPNLALLLKFESSYIPLKIILTRRHRKQFCIYRPWPNPWKTCTDAIVTANCHTVLDLDNSKMTLGNVVIVLIARSQTLPSVDSLSFIARSHHIFINHKDLQARKNVINIEDCAHSSLSNRIQYIAFILAVLLLDICWQEYASITPCCTLRDNFTHSRFLRYDAALVFPILLENVTRHYAIVFLSVITQSQWSGDHDCWEGWKMTEYLDSSSVCLLECHIHAIPVGKIQHPGNELAKPQRLLAIQSIDSAYSMARSRHISIHNKDWQARKIALTFEHCAPSPPSNQVQVITLPYKERAANQCDQNEWLIETLCREHCNKWTRFWIKSSNCYTCQELIPDFMRALWAIIARESPAYWQRRCVIIPNEGYIKIHVN